jgi:hypothetical protein
MNRAFLTLISTAILAASGTARASLASCYNYDIAHTSCGFTQDKAWVWTYAGPKASNTIYKLTNGHIVLRRSPGAFCWHSLHFS